MEKQDDEANGHGDHEVDPLPLGLVMGGFTLRFHAQEIDAHRSGQCGEGGIRRRQRRSDKSQQEQDGQGVTEATIEGNPRKEEVGFFDAHAAHFRVHEQKRPKSEEKQVHEDQDDGEGGHVQLGFTQVPTAQVLLHHVLVQSCHAECNEGSGHKLFHTVVRRAPILEEPPLGVTRGSDGSGNFGQPKIEFPSDEQDGGTGSQQHASGL